VTGVASDVFKVEGEDLDTQGYLRGDRVRLGRRRSRIVGASPLARSRFPTALYKRDGFKFTGNVWYKLRLLSQPSNTRTNIPKHASGPIS